MKACRVHPPVVDLMYLSRTPGFDPRDALGARSLDPASALWSAVRETRDEIREFRWPAMSRRAAIVARGSRDTRSRLAFAITLFEASEELKGWS
jgi:hypothetical protein